MKLFSVVLLALLLSANLFGAESSISDQQVSDSIHALLKEWDHTNGPGFAVAVVSKGRVIYLQGFGMADVEKKIPITPDTLFDLASVSKQFCAVSILQLAEKGLVSLDDPMTKYFPDFPEYASHITVRNLLNHTSGLVDYMDLLVDTGKIEEYEGRPSSLPPAKYEPTAAEVVSLLSAQKKPLFAAGEKWEYSNSAYVVLGQLVEKVSGMRYAEYLKQNIFGPAGMSRTLLYDERKQAFTNRARSYREGRTPRTYEEMDYTALNLIYGDGNVNSTVTDMAKWLLALSSGKMLQPASFQELLKPASLNNGTNTGYSLGFYSGSVMGLQRISHTGGWVGFRNAMIFFPTEELGVVLLSNSLDFDERNPLVYRICKLLLGDKLVLPESIHLRPSVLKSFPGKYEFGKNDAAKILLAGDSLRIQYQNRTHDLVPIGLATFCPADIPGDRISFSMKGGKSVGLTWYEFIYGYAETAGETAKRKN